FIVLTLLLDSALLIFNLTLMHIRDFVLNVFRLLFRELVVPPSRGNKSIRYQNEYSIPDPRSNKSVASVMHSVREMLNSDVKSLRKRDVPAPPQAPEPEPPQMLTPRSLTFREKMHAAGLASTVPAPQSAPASFTASFDSVTYEDYVLPPVT